MVAPLNAQLHQKAEINLCETFSSLRRPVRSHSVQIKCQKNVDFSHRGMRQTIRLFQIAFFSDQKMISMA